MQINTPSPQIIAALGPTNTGKTYLAFERMLGYGSGMIGFPLRLLARENYERAVTIKGSRQVALITGEEKIVPPYAKYYFCTVESMPIDKSVAFLAVDEIQMCSDPERGHIFTDRLLHARGRQETMFMGAESIKPLIKKLVPEIKIRSRRRFSTLTYSGPRNIVRLPPRTAVVGFAAADVYEIAELICRQRGGAAIVMGALSPRTRNAQVNLFQNGDVDYLVATDAIGMGLNMDVDHVAFSSVSKFDGTVRRDLRSDELGQISGRAGRHMRDGTFGVTGDAQDLSPEIVEAIESHAFMPLKFLFWRNPFLDYSDIDTLLSTLGRAPNQRGLVKVQEPDDERFLKDMLNDPKIMASAKGEDVVRLLWEVCQVPNYKKSLGGDHVRLLSEIYNNLRKYSCLPVDWVADQVSRLDLIDGDVETLVSRIAGIRLWTYVAHRNDWLEDVTYWQERTREVEDKLSDALHRGLTQRFVDQRTATLMKRLKDKDKLFANVKDNGEVLVEGHFVGNLIGFRFLADTAESSAGGKAVRMAALKALGREVARRAHKFLNDPDKTISISDEGKVEWRGDCVAQLVKGVTPLKPRIVMKYSELLEQPAYQQVENRLNNWLETYIGSVLKPLLKIQEVSLEGAARGIAFQLIEGLGVLSKRTVKKQIRLLTENDYSTFRHNGIKMGRNEIFIPALLKPKRAAFTALLWAVFRELDKIPSPPVPGRVSIPISSGLPSTFYHVAGFRRIGPVLMRVDILERLSGQIRRRGSEGAFAVDAELLNLAGCTRAEMDGILNVLGYPGKSKDGQTLYKKSPNKLHRKKQYGGVQKALTDPINEGSPFAKLKDLMAS